MSVIKRNFKTHNMGVCEQKNIDFSHGHVRHAARLSFMFAGVNFAVWGALIPFLKVNLQVNDAALGLLLLCLGLGAMAALPFAAALAARFGCRRILQVAVPLEFIGVLGICVVENVWLAAVLCLLRGIMVGIVDVVINIQAVFMEKGCGQKLMSHMHAMLSLGSIVGGMVMVALLSAGLSPFVSVLLLTAMVCCVMWLYCARHFLPYGKDESDAQQGGKQVFPLPKGIVIVIGAVCFLLYMNGAVLLDWGALLLVEEHAIAMSQSSLAFTIYASATVTGRLMGNRVMQAFGVRKVLVVGAMLAAMGYGIIFLAPNVWTAFGGFALVGLGASNIIPQLYSFSAKQSTMSTHMAIAAISFMGFSGKVVGPAFMGVVAEVFTLPVVFGSMFFFLCLVAAMVSLLTKNLQ